MHIRQKPYNIFIITGVIFILASFFAANRNYVDIHLHDTYFVVALSHIFWLLAFLILLLWLLYFLTNRYLYSKTLTWIHVIITTVVFVLFSAVLSFGGSAMSPIRYYDFSNWNSMNSFSIVPKILGTALIILLAGQVTFIINVMIGLFRLKLPT